MEIMCSLISTILTAIVTYFLTRKKYKAEVEHQLIENHDEKLNFYIKLIDDNGQRLERLLEKNEALEAQIVMLKEQVIRLTELLKKYEALEEFLKKMNTKTKKTK